MYLNKHPPSEMSSSRHSICTHSFMTRVFDSSKQQVCDSCGRPSRLGWVYLCTEDHDSFLPDHEAAEFFSTSNPSVLKRVDPHVETSQLSTWINKAIEDGHYTPEQVEILKTQRANVQKKISSIAAAPAEPEGDNPLTRLFERLKDTHVAPSSADNDGTEPVEPPNKETLHVSIPACRYRCCSACRPTMTRDRSWVSLNRVCDDDSYTRDAPEWELQNRRISNLHSVRNLGLRPTGPRIFQFTPDKPDIPSPNEPESPKSSAKSTPTKRTPRRSYEAVRRPSVGRRIPLKRTTRGSFSRGLEGLLHFENGKVTQKGMYKRTTLLTSRRWVLILMSRSKREYPSS